MADKKISQLTGATTPLAGTEVLPIVQGGSTVKVAVSDLTAGRTIAAVGATLSGLTASAAVATDGSKNLVSVTNTGSGNNVLSGSPTCGGNWTISGAYDVNQSNGWYVTNGQNQTGATGYGTSLRLTSDGSGNYTSRIVNVAGGTSYNSLIFDGLNVKVGDGNLVVGTAGKGIDFSANTHAAGMTSELLNWYEEGTWTPVVADASSGGNTGTFSGSATYTRIGRQVTVRMYISNINTTGMTAGNTLFIRGLPFASAATAQGSFYTYRVGRDASTVSSCANIPGAGSFFNFALFTTNSATVDKTILVSDIVSGTSEIQATITYFV